MPVYFARFGRNGPIKIGWTKAGVTNRIRALDCGSPEPIVLLRESPGGRKVEQELHRRFAHLYIRGEWFQAADDLLDFIARGKIPSEYALEQRARRIRDRCRELRLSGPKFAELSGVCIASLQLFMKQPTAGSMTMVENLGRALRGRTGPLPRRQRRARRWNQPPAPPDMPQV